MIYKIDETHDSSIRSWLPSANTEGCDFPLQNLPFCAYRDGGRPTTIGVGIGDQILDLRAIAESGALALEADLAHAASQSTLNELMRLEPERTLALRKLLFAFLKADAPHARDAIASAHRLLSPMSEVCYELPCRIGGYTDFLTSRHHTERHGRFKGLKDPLPPAFLSLPVAYNGRVSSMRVSGTDVVRPRGQFKDASGEVVYGAAVAMDFELEMGAFVRLGNRLAHPVPIRQASRHLFGLTLFNDWSAKDIQWWEQVLGPFLGKSFMTSLSPWVVTMEALAPFRIPASPREAGDPPLMSHLRDPADQELGGFDVEMRASMASQPMRDRGEPATRVSLTNLRALYWTFAQMLCHHASNGCNLEPGDFIGSGTASGATSGSEGCLTEITRAGTVPIKISELGEERRWLEDGDKVTFSARATREGFAPIGFGECTGRLVPAIDL